MEIWHKRIKELRENSDITLKDMAKIIGVSEGTVQRYESGKIKELPYKVIEAYAEKFHVLPSYIMGWTDSPDNSNYTIYDALMKIDGDNFRPEDYKIRSKKEPLDFTINVNDEELVILECYRKLTTNEKDMIKRLLDYNNRLNEIRELQDNDSRQ